MFIKYIVGKLIKVPTRKDLEISVKNEWKRQYKPTLFNTSWNGQSPFEELQNEAEDRKVS